MSKQKSNDTDCIITFFSSCYLKISIKFLLLAVFAGKIPNTRPTTVDVPKANKNVDSETLALNGRKAEIPIATPNPAR